MEEEKKPRGRPKVPWDPFDEELWKRLKTGAACEHLEAEAAHLADWSATQGIHLKKERIRERIKRRFNGTVGYKEARLYHLAELQRTNDLNKSSSSEI
jgi:hypothetical protein